MVSTVTARVIADAEPTEDSQSLIISYYSLANLGRKYVHYNTLKKEHKNATCSLEKGTLLSSTLPLFVFKIEKYIPLSRQFIALSFISLHLTAIVITPRSMF